MTASAATVPIKARERTAILRSLRAGVVPRIGLQHVQVGRKKEVAALLDDLADVAKGASSIRFVIGRFGSGKSFFLNLASVLAVEKGFLVARADITTDRRLHGSGGQARALYAELMRNLSSRAKAEGGALPSVIERWISHVSHDGAPQSSNDAAIDQMIRQGLRPLQDLVSGFDLSTVLARYFTAFEKGNQAGQDAAVRWLRAEYSTKLEARRDLGVRSIIDDSDFYDYLKLFAKFARLAGYSGVVVCIDEMVVLSHRLASSRARNNNYETLLTMLNDCLQGGAEGLLLLFGGTDEFLEDKRRGLYSYEALATRLAPNQFAAADSPDLAGPIIRLKNLTPEDLFVLLTRIRDVYALADPAKYLIPDEGLAAYIEYSARTLGDQYFKTPRETVTRFCGLMDVLEADPSRDWKAVLGQADAIKVAPSESAEANPAPPPEDDDLENFRL